MRLFAALAASTMLLVAAPALAQSAGHDHHAMKIDAKAALAAAVASPLRDKDRARDQYRRPAETLSFFKVEPTMKVGEYAPGGEWYSRLLGLYLGPKGKLVGLYLSHVRCVR